MFFYKRLRWQLFGSQFLVAFVGVTIMMVATRVIILSAAPIVIRPSLEALIDDPQLLAQTEAKLIIAFRNAVLLSVLVAALGAIAAGALSSLQLWRTIIDPLRQVARSSQRIAGGRYGERLDVPERSGQAMAQLVTNFNQMTAALESVEQQRITLLGNISHELRTPLTGLKGYLEGLVDGLFPANEETFGWMSNEVERLHRLVADIHQLSLVEAGEFSLQPADFALQELVGRIQAQLLPQAQAKEVELTVQMPETDVKVHADADRATQVLLNLASNALRYTPSGGRITLRLEQNDHFACLHVEDSGIGIPPEALPYIFERFYRVDHSRNRKSGGSGIGLTISRHLAWAMGGDITAVSAGEGHGSAFTLTLPLAGTGKIQG